MARRGWWISAFESLIASVFAEVSRAIVEKARSGKKLSIEEILLLYLDLVYTQIGSLRKELREVNRRIDEINRRIDEMRDEMGKKIDETNKRIDRVYHDLAAKIDETNRRVDRLYELLARGGTG